MGVPTTSVVGEWLEFTVQAVDTYSNERDTQVEEDPHVKVSGWNWLRVLVGERCRVVALTLPLP